LTNKNTRSGDAADYAASPLLYNFSKILFPDKIYVDKQAEKWYNVVVHVMRVNSSPSGKL